MYQRRVEARRRQREESQTVETFDPYEIYERDMWRCGLCGDAIDKQLRYPHPYSVSLDHIIPLARLGDHSRGNTQAAHLTCNVRKGARVA
jgi:5-methylcytosine-specific restriction endonuclease McrA